MWFGKQLYTRVVEKSLNNQLSFVLFNQSIKYQYLHGNYLYYLRKESMQTSSDIEILWNSIRIEKIYAQRRRISRYKTIEKRETNKIWIHIQQIEIDKILDLYSINKDRQNLDSYPTNKYEIKYQDHPLRYPMIKQIRKWWMKLNFFP